MEAVLLLLSLEATHRSVTIYGQSRRPAVLPVEHSGVGGVGHILPGDLGKSLFQSPLTASPSVIPSSYKLCNNPSLSPSPVSLSLLDHYHQHTNMLYGSYLKM